MPATWHVIRNQKLTSRGTLLYLAVLLSETLCIAPLPSRFCLSYSRKIARPVCGVLALLA